MKRVGPGAHVLYSTGNRYYEYPLHLSPALRRPRRAVKYANPDHMFPGTAGLPSEQPIHLSKDINLKNNLL